MTPFEEQNEESALLENRPPRGHPYIAWTVIILVSGLVFVGQQYRPEPPGGQQVEKSAGVDMHEFQARYFVGVPQVFPLSRNDMYRQLFEGESKPLFTGSFHDRLRAVIVAGELGGPEEALKWLGELDQVPLTPEDHNREENHRAARLFKQLYRNYKIKPDPSFLQADDREFLRKEMGWAGELALAPEGGPDPEAREAALKPSRNVVLAIVGGLAGGCGGVLVGIVLLILILLAIFGVRARPGFVPGSPYGSIYAETFALWLVVFVGLQLAGLFLPPDRSQLVRSALLSMVSLLVLGWPVLRGVPWSQVRQDVGLGFLGQPVRQVLSGPICYLSSLPLLLIGFAGLFLLTFLQRMLAPQAGGGVEEGMHPIVRYFAHADGWVLFQIFFAACVAAPLVEETFFRGVLYRHLREATSAWRSGWSILTAGLATSFLFAWIHPQGIIGVPLLMSLAMGFTLTREWRGSLVPCMIAHGINNGLVLLLALYLFGK
jgi:membrane protease YdiL (CAAX protease family)